MPTKNPAVDHYIANTADFAQPILKKIRRLVHRACPRVSETIKWGIPYFEYHGLLLGMAAFKQHVSFGFWKSKQMRDPAKLFVRGAKASMCNIRAATVKELPTDEIILQYLAEAIQLNEDSRDTSSAVKSGAKSKMAGAKSQRKAVIVPAIPADLRQHLAGNESAAQYFNQLSPGAQRDYIVWIESAKRPATRATRLATTIMQLAQQKTLNWKYERKH